MQATPDALPSFTTALRAVEALLTRGGHRTARSNAWTSVLEDRRRAEDRTATERALARSLDGTARTS
ncbi:hypothetical protein JNUCC64_25890 [Streptomyces sp. JNUCC 64]